MRSPKLGSLVAAALALCGGVTAPALRGRAHGPQTTPRALPAARGGWTISLRGAGPIRFGMSFAEVRKALGDPEASLFAANPFASNGSGSRGGNGCGVLMSKALPDGVGLMFLGGKAVRVDVFARGAAATDRGARVDDFEERIEALYAGHIRTETDPQDPNGHYLIYGSGNARDNGYELLFETDGHDVTSFRAGLRAAVELAKGCG